MSACTGINRPSPTVHEAIPAPGSFHLTADPPRASRALSLTYVGEDGVPSRISDEFVPGAVVAVNRSNLPGTNAVRVNGQTCDGRLSLVKGVETDIVLVLTDDGCRVVTTGSHPEGALQHGE